MSRPPTFLLLSGHNDRAVVALCRFFRANALPHVIVASGRDDAIHRTDFDAAVVANRIDRVLDVEMFAGLARGRAGRLVYCPTTEFGNHFVLAHRRELEHAGLDIGLPEQSVYEQLTGKFSSQAVVERLTGVAAPPTLPLDAVRAPCVIKPRQNVRSSRVLYPHLCLTPEALADVLPTLDPALWFAQKHVLGQSHYLCGYLARDGRRAWYWQDNLLQQPGGKSIVLARVGANPGVDADRLFDGLARMRYHGPFMMELISDAAGRLHYIEINPRFWGPLQLALEVCPLLLALFARDHGARLDDPPVPPAGAASRLYAWAFGASQPGCRRYPAADALGPAEGLPALLARHDLYAAADTRALHLQH